MRASDKTCARIINQDINTTPVFHGFVHYGFDLIILPHIARYRIDYAAFFSDAVRNWAEMIHRAAGNHDLRSATTKFAGDIRAYTRPTTGHDRYLAANVKCFVCHLSPCSLIFSPERRALSTEKQELLKIQDSLPRTQDCLLADAWP